MPSKHKMQSRPEWFSSCDVAELKDLGLEPLSRADQLTASEHLQVTHGSNNGWLLVRRAWLYPNSGVLSIRSMAQRQTHLLLDVSNPTCCWREAADLVSDALYL
jgi:hypothetical protein